MNGQNTPMLSGASVTAQSVNSSTPSGLRRDQQISQPQTVDPSADGFAAKSGDPSAAAEKVQPASQAEETNAETRKPDDGTTGRKANGEPLSEAEEKQVQELKKRDAEVRAHEQAHAAAGGPYTSAPSYEFTTGPDGKRYATSGEVQIDASPVKGDPEATIRKMDIVIRAALAPAEPSAQDKAVARQAQAQRTQAQAELSRQRASERNGGSDEHGSASGTAASGGILQQIVAQAAQAYGSRERQNAVEIAGAIFSAAA